MHFYGNLPNRNVVKHDVKDENSFFLNFVLHKLLGLFNFKHGLGLKCFRLRSQASESFQNCLCLDIGNQTWNFTHSTLENLSGASAKQHNPGLFI